jgi:4-carboxymuconolactone decarboxylase
MKPATAAAIAAFVFNPAGATEPEISISRAGSRAISEAPGTYFTGSATVEMLSMPAGAERASAGLVTFRPGARTHWHTHPLGQTLIVTAGVGRIQRWGGAVDEIRPGDVVRIPPGVKHWHGAAPDSTMTHLAVQEALDGKAVDWLEPVGDDQYRVSPTVTTAVAPNAPSPAQKLMGDVAPKLAQLTDDVLFGDVWARPGLSRRGRSLVTISALIAMNRPEQLRSQLALGRQNGLTEAEIVAAVTQLAFYAGWPSAVTAVGVTREVFAKP